MSSELAFISLTELQNLPQHPQMNPNLGPSATWNPRNQDSEQENEDDSWEVRAFAQDTSNILGTTWPPRSYTCTFCGREFRSAQALGGHMNVHRRDRARLHQNMMPSSSNVLVPTTQEFVPNAGLCFLYNLPQNTNNNGVFMSKMMNLPSEVSPPSTRLSISPYNYPNNLLSPPSLPPPPRIDPPSNSMENHGSSSSTCDDDIVNKRFKKDLEIEELDLELRLGP